MQNDEELVPSGSDVLSDPNGTDSEIIEEEPEESSEEPGEESQNSSDESVDKAAEESEYSSERFQPHYENLGETYVTETTQSSDVFVDYSGYFENLQTLDILILGCLVAIGCILAWIGAKRE